MTFKDWIVATRIHTAALTIPGVVLGALLADNRSTISLIFFGVWALLFHGVGFLGNNLYDLPYDRKDAAKAHFPLVNGAIEEDAAWRAYYAGMLATILFGLLGTIFNAIRDPKNSSYVGGAIFLVVAILFGMAYNASSKKSLWAPLWINLSFASLPAFSFLASGGAVTSPLLWYISTYSFALMLFQIAFSGYYKDILTDPVSLLRSLGIEVKVWSDGTYFEFPLKARVFGWVLRWAAPTIAIVFYLSTASFFPTPHSYATIFLFSLFLCGVILSFLPLPRSGLVVRSRAMRWIALTEIMTYFLLVASVQDIVGIPIAIGLYLGPLAWFAILNKIMWGTLLVPRV